VTRLCPSLPARAFALAGALGLSACGDGQPLRLGTTSIPEPFDASGTGGADGATPGDARDSGAGCPSGEAVPPALSLLLESDDLVGFGSTATGGGRDSCLYRVTNSNDSGPGSLRAGMEQAGPLWIVFDQAVDITLLSKIKAQSHKTIDGRGLSVKLRNYGFEIAGQENFVIVNLSFDGQRHDDPALPDNDHDAITLKQGAHAVWIDHCTFQNYRDGLVDITQGSTDVTISWSHFTLHENVMLLVSEDDTPEQGRMLRVTLHHNWFDHTERYNPRIRWGFVHMFNNLLDTWGDWGVAASQQSSLYSEWNVYFAGSSSNDSKEAIILTHNSEPNGKVNSDNDEFAQGADPPATIDRTVARPTYAYVPQRVNVHGYVVSMAGSRP